MKLSGIVLGLLAISHEVAAVVDKWTPADFDWNRHVGRDDVATQNMTTARVPTREMVLFASDQHNITESDLVTAAGLVSTGIGCYELIAATVGGEQTTGASKASCVLGIAATALGFGLPKVKEYLQARQAWAAARVSSTPPLLPAPDFGNDFVQSFELAGFDGLTKRDLPFWGRALQGRGLSIDEQWNQYFHNDFTASMIRDSNFGEGEFLGYADDNHQLTKRDGVHALVPRYKFAHPTHGPMILSTRFTNTTSHITVEPYIVGNPKIHKRYQEEYQKEILEDNKLLEARFDHEAADADPAGDGITIDPVNTFQMAEDTLHCALSGRTDDGWPLDQVLDVQAYDDTNKATFGYATLGVFNNHDHDNELGDLQPQPPITGGEDCWVVERGYSEAQRLVVCSSRSID
ncbi:uncharacterized protein CLAFUR5_07063 [Fulvia fulva]|uniref:Uncharacterized protein n=1 Tax=Passalora fulva TaxID=5499 RepID=A0A9Q8P9Q1_PASFU|nr:uncharacterized protein CLAFUR5_07063 [Fulvia fulva]KAK4622435.1 hypothetical protein CLAFUR0_06933 [Fulvia fulva]UJO18525.1 hypothetical protein CLAFUR5_07063 [Fulvia fulva]